MQIQGEKKEVAWGLTYGQFERVKPAKKEPQIMSPPTATTGTSSAIDNCKDAYFNTSR